MFTPAPDIFLPHPATITRVVTENSQIKTFVLRFNDLELQSAFTYRPGQFLMLSVPGQGEAPISIASSPSRPGTLELAVRKAGRLTSALHELQEGAVVGLRGPYGGSFPVEHLLRRDVLFVAGGIGLAPLRSVITWLLDQEEGGQRLIILYGSRSPEDIAFRADLELWQADPRVDCFLTVDAASPGWNGQVGVVTTLLDKVSLAPAASSALVCGPPIMIRFTLAELHRMGFADDEIITTLERHMKCGVGLCGHCHMDSRLVCVDGPVFSRSELLKMDVEELQP